MGFDEPCEISAALQLIDQPFGLTNSNKTS